MSRRYSSSTNASRVAEGRSSRPGFVTATAQTPPIAEVTDNDAVAAAAAAAAPSASSSGQRTFFGGLSVHSGKTGRIARRLSNRGSRQLSEPPSTFYREATPPGSSHGRPEDEVEEEAAYDGRYDYIAPPAPLPVATVCGIPRRRFCIMLWTVVAVVVVIAVAVPVGVVFGLRGQQHKSAGDMPATSNVSHPPSTVTSTATTTTTTTSTAVFTTAASCPAANNTLYLIPDTAKTFRRLCGVDYSGVDQARDLGSVWTTTMQDCIFQCADFAGCEACGWGIIADDPGSEHRCWLKADLRSSRSVRAGWEFAILER